MDDKIYDYIVRIIHKTRDHELIQQGASPRTSISLLKMVKAIAYMDHRNYVIPDDIKKVIYDVLSHRLILTYDAKVKGVVIQENEEWIILHQSQRDFNFDGYLFINKNFIKQKNIVSTVKGVVIQDVIKSILKEVKEPKIKI